MKRLIIIMSCVCLIALSVYAAEQYQSFRGKSCEWCGTTGTLFNRLEWAHEKPQAYYPELVNDPANGVTLCHKCHRVIGHGHNTKRWNPNLIFIVHTYGGIWVEGRQ